MKEQDWTGNLAIIISIISLLLSWASYRYTRRIKLLELRLELRRTIVDVNFKLNSMEQLIIDVSKSKMAGFSADGQLRGGVAQKWNTDVQEDLTVVRNLVKIVPGPENTYLCKSATELESELMKIHEHQIAIDQLQEKYTAIELECKQRFSERRKAAELRHQRNGTGTPPTAIR